MNNMRFYINGSWVEPVDATPHDVIDPSTEEAYTQVAWGTQEEVETAVAAARAAFASWGTSTKDERLAALRRLLTAYERRMPEIGKAISQEMGAPIDLAMGEQAESGQYHLKSFIAALEDLDQDRPFPADQPRGRIMLEPIGVAALITPWNWPMNQVCLKVGAALAAGCTMILKPSEIAPISSIIFAEIVDEADIPAGVFNLINGDGAGVGSALSLHPDIEIVSFTGSTRAGKLISKSAADNIKRVSLELGGKSPNLIFADADLKAAVEKGVSDCFENTGQTCTAPTRMLVERSVYDQVVELAGQVAANTKVDMPSKPGDHIGPLVSRAQFEKVQELIEKSIKEGARLVAGGPGRPEGQNRGWFARPTIFADVTQDMTIWREEAFGPVLSIAPFNDENHAIELANDSDYGLAAYLQTGNADRARRVARSLRSGRVSINGVGHPEGAPFGGYKQSGNGREAGLWGIEEFLEVKSVSGWPTE